MRSHARRLKALARGYLILPDANFLLRQYCALVRRLPTDPATQPLTAPNPMNYNHQLQVFEENVLRHGAQPERGQQTHFDHGLKVTLVSKSQKMTGFELPRRLPTYRLRLHAYYSSGGDALLRDLIGNSHAYVVEETSYDNWNGGTYGHDVQLFLPMKELSKVDINDIDRVTQKITEDLNKVSASVPNEFFANVHLELFDENDGICQRARPLHSRTERDADTLSIWKRGMVRLFISHRDGHKVVANELAETLESYGISSFVAHDSIQPMSIWQTEILNGLESMEIMLAFVTDDFHESVWTNQEVGFALGRNIPVVPLKLQDRDPSGFIGKQQALKWSYDNVAEAAPSIYEILAEKLSNRERLQTSLIRAFASSPDFHEARWRFDRMRNVVSKISDTELEEIVVAFRENDQLHNAIYLENKYHRLSGFLGETSEKSIVIEGKTISVIDDDAEDEVPF